MISKQVGWFDDKGVCLHLKSQGIKLHGRCCVWSGNDMLTKYYLIDFLE
jgi:hypothetical protein